MSKHNVVELSGRETGRDEVTELIRDGAHKLISEAASSLGASSRGPHTPR